MKFITSILLTALLGYAAPLYLPWWSFAITTFIVFIFLRQSPGKSFLAGFLGLFLLWGCNALWIDIANNHILSQKVAVILPLGGSSVLLIFLTACIGGLISGFSGLAAAYTRKK
ncbi:MAG: hypothetical protein JSS67_08935 [Bacteroidetes bacterium]|nr:hypothetical protein [Bacteroidota bacterium]